jgi:TonB family protein
MPTLEQLEVSLNPGTGDLSLGTGLGVNLDFSTESTSQLEEIFGFGDLDEMPHLVREGRFRYPPNSPRGRGEAFVRLLIYVETDGRISVQKVIDYSHKEFIEAATRMAEGSRFSPPMRKGQAVRSSYEWPIRIPLK